MALTIGYVQYGTYTKEATNSIFLWYTTQTKGLIVTAQHLPFRCAVAVTPPNIYQLPEGYIWL